MSSWEVKILVALLRDMLRRALVWLGGLDRCEEVLHVKRKIGYSVVICNRSGGAKVDTFLTGVRRYVRPDLLEKVEDVSGTQVCRCCPFFSPGAPQEETSEEIEMNSVSAEAKAGLGLRVLHCQIDIPACLP